MSARLISAVCAKDFSALLPVGKFKAKGVSSLSACAGRVADRLKSMVAAPAIAEMEVPVVLTSKSISMERAAAISSALRIIVFSAPVLFIAAGSWVEKLKSMVAASAMAEMEVPVVLTSKSISMERAAANSSVVKIIVFSAPDFITLTGLGVEKLKSMVAASAMAEMEVPVVLTSKSISMERAAANSSVVKIIVLSVPDFITSAAGSGAISKSTFVAAFEASGASRTKSVVGLRAAVRTVALPASSMVAALPYIGLFGSSLRPIAAAFCQASSSPEAFN